MGIHDFLGGVEAKPCSGISAPRTILRMVEGLEQVRDLFLGYSDSLIGDLPENLPRPGAEYIRGNALPFPTFGLDCVGLGNYRLLKGLGNLKECQRLFPFILRED